MLKITGMTKTIDDQFQLGPIDVHIERGTISALIGNNGAGKSTFLKIIMNLVKQNEGEVELFGSLNRTEEEWKTKVAYLPQSMPGAIPFTGKEMKALASRWYPSWDEAFFKRVIDLFDVPMTKPYEKMSQGGQQKLNLALALSKNAELLIMDEPTSHLDIPAKKLLLDLIVDWMDQGDRTLIFASHQIEDIRKLADYLIVMKDGKMVGKFEKEQLGMQYKRYWIADPLPSAIPGEIERGEGTLVTKEVENTERFLHSHNIKWSMEKSLELDEILAYMLADRTGGQQKWKTY